MLHCFALDKGQQIYGSYRVNFREDFFFTATSLLLTRFNLCLDIHLSVMSPNIKQRGTPTLEGLGMIPRHNSSVHILHHTKICHRYFKVIFGAIRNPSNILTDNVLQEPEAICKATTELVVCFRNHPCQRAWSKTCWPNPAIQQLNHPGDTHSDCPPCSNKGNQPDL